MEALVFAILIVLGLWILLSPNNKETPPPGYAPVAPDASTGARVQAVEYWDTAGDPLTEGEQVAAYLAQCTASRPCVATANASRRQRHQARLAEPQEQGIPVDWFAREREKQKVRR